MNNISQETLRRVTQNDPSLTELSLVDNNNYDSDGKFVSDNSDDYSTLGAAIANNTHLEMLIVTLSDGLPLGVANIGFYDGLTRNSSIHQLMLRCDNQNIAGGIGLEILKVYQENNNHLATIIIIQANLQSGGDSVIVDTLRNCRNLQIVTLNSCSITDDQLLPIVEAVRELGITIQKGLYLYENNIGNAGCEAIATLLADPNCNLRYLNLRNNAIHNEGATTIANSLINNNKLQKLYLDNNPTDQTIQDVFSNILCNTSSIEQTDSSNHTIQTIDLGHRHGHGHGQQLESLLELNRDTNKSHVAIKKILKYHPNMDMEPQLFEWGAEEGEQNLKALPHVVNWFERARVAVADEEGEQYNLDGRKLNAIFQFAKAVPLLFGGIAIKRDDDKVNKRKRND